MVNVRRRTMWSSNTASVAVRHEIVTGHPVMSNRAVHIGNIHHIVNTDHKDVTNRC